MKKTASPRNLNKVLAAALAALGLLAAAPAVADVYSDARKLYDKGDYTAVKNMIVPLAAQGDAKAQYILSFLYEEGKGVGKNTALAAEYRQKALPQLQTLAQQGDRRAQAFLGFMYDRGLNVPQNYALARQWYEKAAAQSDAQAQNNLGWLYYNGHGVAQNYTLARQWLEKAAAQGNENAKKGLQTLKSMGY